MNTIDKIRAEIERLQECNHRMADNAINSNMRNFYDGEEDCCKQILSFLDTLEEPESEDLEEAADVHIRKVVDAAGHPGWDWETQDIADAFKAGAEWMKAKMIEGATYNELMELYRAIRNELVKRHRDVPVNIKEEL